MHFICVVYIYKITESRNPVYVCVPLILSPVDDPRNSIRHQTFQPGSSGQSQGFFLFSFLSTQKNELSIITQLKCIYIKIK